MPSNRSHPRPRESANPSKTKSPSPLLAWHYTTGDRLTAIQKSGVIRTTAVGLSLDLDAARADALNRKLANVTTMEEVAAVLANANLSTIERPAAWFTLSTTGDTTASASSRDGTQVRIGVPADGLTTWAEHRRTSGIDARVADALEETARDKGSDHEMWLVSYEPVPRERWLKIERWRGGAWTAVRTR